MRRRKLPYQEGDWFAVPLERGGYGLGLVARMDGRGTILGYFFGPRREEVPTEQDAEALSPADALMVEMFGDLGLLRGDWPVIGRSTPWHREEWPLPAFARYDILDPGIAWLVEYDEDTLEPVRETRVKPETVRHLPKDGLSGYRAVAIGLEDLLPE